MLVLWRNALLTIWSTSIFIKFVFAGFFHLSLMLNYMDKLAQTYEPCLNGNLTSSNILITNDMFYKQQLNFFLWCNGDARPPWGTERTGSSDSLALGWASSAGQAGNFFVVGLRGWTFSNPRKAAHSPVAAPGKSILSAYFFFHVENYTFFSYLKKHLSVTFSMISMARSNFSHLWHIDATYPFRHAIKYL